MNQDLIYLAGFVDGEGCITIAHPQGKTNYSMTFEVTQKRRKILDWIEQKFGGHVSQATNSAYVWCICCKKARNLLIKLYPYLKLKREQARYAVIFENLVPSKKDRSRDKKGRYTPISEAEGNMRRKLYLKLRSLKKVL